MPDPSMVTPIVRRQVVELFVERYTKGNQTATVKIFRGLYPNFAVLYEGRGRLHRMQGSVQMGFGDEPQYMVTGTISVPLIHTDGTVVNPQVNDFVFIVQHHDPDSVGRLLRVVHVDHGGQWNGVVSMSVIGSEDSTTSRLPHVNPFHVAGTVHEYILDDHRMERQIIKGEVEHG
jgi:Family of unknown function (DUF6093)